MSGTKLSDRCQGTSVAAIEDLYRARAPAFVRFATAMLGDAELARDVVQDAFAQALRGRERFRGEGSLEAWLWSAVVNTSRNAGRARAVRRRFALRAAAPALRAAGGRLRTSRVEDHGGAGIEDLGGEATAALMEARIGERSALRHAIAQLPERQRMCIFLRYFADLDYAAIAAALGISAGTVGATLNAAHATLRRKLEEQT